jgi:hypothetical protein
LKSWLLANFQKAQARLDFALDYNEALTPEVRPRPIEQIIVAGRKAACCCLSVSKSGGRCFYREYFKDFSTHNNYPPYYIQDAMVCSICYGRGKSTPEIPRQVTLVGESSYGKTIYWLGPLELAFTGDTIWKPQHGAFHFRSILGRI